VYPVQTFSLAGLERVKNWSETCSPMPGSRQASLSLCLSMK
jgi:hypothetical protein